MLNEMVNFTSTVSESELCTLKLDQSATGQTFNNTDHFLNLQKHN